MQEESRPWWLGKVSEAVQLEIEARVASAPASQGNETETVGEAVPDGAAGPGWFRVDLRGRQLDLERVEDGWLAPAENADSSYRILDAVREADQLRVRVGPAASDTELFLRLPPVRPALRLEALAERLAGVSSTPLLDHFPAGLLHPLPEVPPPGGLQGIEGAAAAVCCAPGLHAVWALPGTARTEVIVAALAEVMERGESVLLVSDVDAAVDDAVLQLADRVQPPPGRVVRAGTPHLAAVAADSRVALPHLVRAAGDELERQRQELEVRILALRKDAVLTEVEEAGRRLEGFDEVEYSRARQRLEAWQDAPWLEHVVQRRRTEVEKAIVETTAAARQESAARQAWDQIAEARAELEEADRLRARLADLRVEREQAALEALLLEGHRAGLEGAAPPPPSSGIRRFSGWMSQRRHEARVFDADWKLEDARKRLRDAKRALASRDELAERVRSCLERALPVTTEEVELRRAALQAAEAELEFASRKERDLRDALAPAERALAAATRFGPPTEADAHLVAVAEAEGLPALADEQRRLQEAATRVRLRLERLTLRHEQVVEQQRRHSADAERTVLDGAGVVATTLALLALKPALYERSYDHVIVDEAAAASPPEVVHAVSRATTGATLVGDFRLSGPVVEPGLRSSPDPVVERWLRADCFALFGIKDAASALSTRGCVCLTDHRCFGPALEELANLLAYEGQLRTAEGVQPGPEPEVVLVDAEGLGQHLSASPAMADGSPWLPAGALIARALADLHSTGGAPVAVATPYPNHAVVIQELLIESERALHAEVGTPRRFLGRAFDTVIVDLVDNRLEATPWSQETERGFNVAVTSARRRLYLVANAVAGKPQPAGPLAAARALGDRGLISTVRTADLVRLSEPPAGGAARAVWEALHRLVGNSDSAAGTLWEQVGHEIDRAETAVHLWLPSPAYRVLGYHLRSARERGVRVTAALLSQDAEANDLHRRVEELRRQVATAVLVRAPQQPLLVVDGRRIWLARRRGNGYEKALAVESESLARRVLYQHGSEELERRPARCPVCQSPVLEADLGVTEREQRWRWLCRRDPPANGCGWEQLFPPAPGGLPTSVQTRSNFW